MQHISSLDVSEYYKINNKISDTVSFDNINSKILSPLSRLIGADTSLFAVLKKNDQGVHAHNFISNSVDNKSRLNYEKNFQNNDPILPHAFNSAKVNHQLGISKSFTFALDNIVDHGKFSRGKYYNEFLRPNSIQQVLATGIPSSTDKSLVYVLGFHRYCNKSFSEKDAQISSYFGPALFNVLNNLELQSKICDHNIIVSHLNNQISETGLVILNNNNDVIFASQTGEKHLNIIQNGTHTYSSLEDGLVTMLNSYIPQMDKTSSKLIEFVYNETKIRVRTVLPDINNQKKRIILNTYSSSKSNIIDTESEKYGLTNREIDICNLIVIGMTSPEISEKLCISIRTVENHLRSIYTKTDVKNRTSLTYKLALHNPKKN